MDETRLICGVEGLMKTLGVKRYVALRLVHTPGFPAIWVSRKSLLVQPDALNAWLAEQAGQN